MKRKEVKILLTCTQREGYPENNTIKCSEDHLV